MKLVKTEVWFSIENCGDGSAYPKWFLTEEDADWDQEHACEGWGETCIGGVETFEGSDIHRDAVENSLELIERKDTADDSYDDDKED